MKTFAIAAIILLTIALVFVVLPQYGIRALPGRVEYLLEPEPETVEYIARPPAELGKQVLSAWVSEQSKESTWSNARGKWVVWKGDVHRVEPILKPSRIIFLHEYEAPMPFYTEQFGVIVEFDSSLTESLQRLNTGETVCYRAKLVARELDLEAAFRYGLGPSWLLLVLEDGQIIDSSDVAAQLADLVYTSYSQLEELIKEAESVAAVSKFFENKLRDGGKRILIETLLELIGVDISEKYWLLEETPLLELQALKNSLKSDIEHHFQEALGVLHHSDPPNGALLCQDIEENLKWNNNTVDGTREASKVLKDFWEEERLSAEPDISDAGLALLLSRLPPIVGATKTITEGITEHGKLDAYETIVGACHLLLGNIESYMEHIHDGVVEVVDNIT